MLDIKNYKNIAAYLLLFLLAFPLGAQTENEANTAPAKDETLTTLSSFVELQKNLLRDITTLNKQLKSAQTEAEKEGLREQLVKLKADLKTTKINFENIAAGIDISLLREEEEQEFNFQKELFSLIRPAIDEMKEMTSRVRQKSDLKEKIAYFNARLPVIENALANIEILKKKQKNKSLKSSLSATANDWEKQQTFMQSELQAAELQLSKLIEAEVQEAKSSRSSLKAFFQKRGLYLAEALLAIIGVILLSRLTYAGLVKFIPGFRKQHRSFRTRLAELLHKIVTLLLTILGPMMVFYLEEDWVLFSLSILLLIGISWTLRQTIPRYWSQIQLFLNIGSVREGERLSFEGLPWLVQRINVYSTLTNPAAGISQRIPLDELVDLRSRPFQSDEPWFPCEKGDWVILGNNIRGKVTGISHELVQLVARGGDKLTYKTEEFLTQSPRNLSTNFRIKETFGIGYSHQKQSTEEIPNLLREYIQDRLIEEGYKEQLLSLKVEFALANSSSLDLLIIADFSGEIADLYNRLRRAIQRWSVDACNKYHWDIPFPQLEIHRIYTESK